MQGKDDGRQIVGFLIEHLGRVESTRNHIVKEYYEERNEERDHFENMVEEYSNHIRGFIDLDRISKEDFYWPLILIGSIVEVQDLDYDEIERLKIVPPFYEERGEKIDCASCLSPVGRALLFKRIGDKVTVNTPLGSCSFMVNAIEPPWV